VGILVLSYAHRRILHPSEDIHIDETCMRKNVILTIFLINISIFAINNVHALENGAPVKKGTLLGASVNVTNETGHGFVGPNPYAKVNLLIRGLSILAVIAVLTTPILVVIVVFIALFQRANKRKIEFIKEKFYEPTKKPVYSDWGIRILKPNKPIEKCIILYNNTRLPWEDKDEPYYEKRIDINGGGTVRVPKAIEYESARVRFKDGKKTLKDVKFKHLYTAKTAKS
jgi:hypothetical protein